MSPELEEKLAQAYPLLFRQEHGEVNATPTTCGFEVGDGWYDLIDSLCGLIYWPYERARQHFESARQGESVEGADRAETTTAERLETARFAMKAAAEALPMLTQVKEKFGTLRVYTCGGDDAVERYVEFAEYFSSRVCEDCGAPGKLRTGGWLRTLCDDHAVGHS
jgi:hypothetical protein